MISKNLSVVDPGFLSGGGVNPQRGGGVNFVILRIFLEKPDEIGEKLILCGTPPCLGSANANSKTDFKSDTINIMDIKTMLYKMF